MLDATEVVRREILTVINAEPGSREALEAEHGQVWSTQELGQDFEVLLGHLRAVSVLFRNSEDYPMPLTLNVGISKKAGLPDFGSVGATCNVSVELDAALLTREPDAFQRHVRNAYAACSEAVNDELTRQTTPGMAAPSGNGVPTAAAGPSASARRAHPRTGHLRADPGELWSE